MRARSTILCGLLVALPAAAADPAPAGPVVQADAIPLQGAREVFARARFLCARDGGRLWGASLCAPVMLVDPGTRQVVASAADRNGVLQARDDVFVGVLPADQNASYTAFEWAGLRWTQLLWPLPVAEPAKRDVLMAHELFHNLQPQLQLPLSAEGDNAHLDTLDGRYYLQLEWRALARALQAHDGGAVGAALADALAFRAARYRRFPSAEAAETTLELNEGLAEYTGVMVGADSAADREAAALDDLASRLADPSFVRSFAYATGPAYGLLLDRMAPGWRDRLGTGINLAWLLRDAAGIEVADSNDEVASAASRYDGAALRAAELDREQERLARLRHNRQRFVAGPLLVLDLAHMQVQFDPRSLQPLDEVGTVYPTLRISDDWGVLEAGNGAMLRADWSAVVVTAPSATAGSPIRGDGWTLTLNPGWKLGPGDRKGDWKLQAPR